MNWLIRKKQAVLLVCSLLISLGLVATSAQAAAWKLPSKGELEKSLAKAAELSPVLSSLTIKDFDKHKKGYWVAPLKEIKQAEVLVYQPKSAKTANIAIITKQLDLAHLYPVLDKIKPLKQAVSGLGLGESAVIFISPSKMVKGEELESVSLKDLPAPLATVIKQADNKREAIQLPTGAGGGQVDTFDFLMDARNQLSEIIFAPIGEASRVQRATANKLISKIDAVQLEDLERARLNILKSNITLSSIGPVQDLESLDSIKARFN